MAWKIKFGEEGKSVIDEVRQLDDIQQLEKILSALAKVSSLEEIRTLIQKNLREEA